MSDLIFILKKSFSGTNLSLASLSVVLGIGLILYIICYFLFFRHRSAPQKFQLAVLFLYCAFVISITIPFSPPNLWHTSPKSTEWVIKNIDWVPFHSAANIFHNALASNNLKEFIRVIGGNFLLLLPLGILVPLIHPKLRLQHMTVVALFLPILIEGLQLLNNILMGSVIRTVETEDVLLNAMGCLLGYLIVAGLRKRLRPKHTARHARTTR